MNLDINKFSFAQMTANNDGKTSGSGTMGVYIVIIGGLCFLLGCIDKMFLKGTIDILTQSIIVITVGAGLLGWRKQKQAKPDSNVVTEEATAAIEEKK